MELKTIGAGFIMSTMAGIYLCAHNRRNKVVREILGSEPPQMEIESERERERELRAASQVFK